MTDRWVTSVVPTSDARDDWEALADRVGASPFLRPGWVEAWLRSFGRGVAEVHLIRRHGNASVAALLPLERRGAVLASPTNWHTPEFGVLSQSEDAARALLASIHDRRPRRFVLGFLDREQAQLADGYARERGFAVLQRTIQHSPYLPLEGDWAGYEKKLGTKRRGKLRRRRRLLAERGEISFEFSEGEDLDARLTEGFAVESAGWKGDQGTAIRSDSTTERFYRDVARFASERGWLRLAFLRCDRRAVAFAFCLEHADRQYLVKTGYEPEFRDLGPGKLLHQELFRRAFERGLGTYEFLGTDAPWKREWTDRTRDRVLVQAFRPTALGRLDFSLHAYGRPLAKQLRDWTRRARSRLPAAETGRRRPE